MAHDQLTQKSQEGLIEVLTSRCDAALTACNQAAAQVGELMLAQLTRDQLLADCIAPLKLLHYLTRGGQPEAAASLTRAQCLQLLSRIEALKK